jgi:hypothetical protein
MASRRERRHRKLRDRNRSSDAPLAPRALQQSAYVSEASKKWNLCGNMSSQGARSNAFVA